MSNTPSNSAPKKGSLLPWVTAILMVTSIAVLAALYWNRTVTVDEIEFSGNRYVLEEELLKASQVTLGVKPDSLDLNAIVKRVEALHYVKSAMPYVEPSGALSITIEERQPLGLLVDGARRIYVDQDGVRLPILSGKTQDLPLIYGFSAQVSSDTLKSKSFTAIRDFLLSAKKDQFGWITISEVAYSPTDGVVALSQENGVKLVFGDGLYETKFENWKVFYAEVVRVKGIQKMQEVDLRFINQVVTREAKS